MKILAILTILSLSACASMTEQSHPQLVDHKGRSEETLKADAFKCSGEATKVVHSNDFYWHCMVELGYNVEMSD